MGSGQKGPQTEPGPADTLISGFWTQGPSRTSREPIPTGFSHTARSHLLRQSQETTQAWSPWEPHLQGPQGREAEPATAITSRPSQVWPRYFRTVSDTSSVFTAFHKDAFPRPRELAS